MKLNSYDIVKINVSKYTHNNNTAIELLCKIDNFIESYAIITTNLDMLLAENKAFLDTNNCPWVVDFMKKYNLGKPLNIFRKSGYCVYPLYELNLENIKKLNEELISNAELGNK